MQCEQAGLLLSCKSRFQQVCSLCCNATWRGKATPTHGLLLQNCSRYRDPFPSSQLTGELRLDLDASRSKENLCACKSMELHGFPPPPPPLGTGTLSRTKEGSSYQLLTQNKDFKKRGALLPINPLEVSLHCLLQPKNPTYDNFDHAVAGKHRPCQKRRAAGAAGKGGLRRDSVTKSQ